MPKFMWVIYDCYCCVDLRLDSRCIHPDLALKVGNCINLRFLPANKVVVKDDMMSNTWLIYWCAFSSFKSKFL